MNTIKKMKSPTPRRVSTVASKLLNPTSSPALFPSRQITNKGRDCECGCDYEYGNGPMADQEEEFISELMAFMSALQPLFEKRYEKSCTPGLQSSGSEKILAFEASNYEDLALQFQNLYKKLHHYKSLKSARLSKGKENECDVIFNNNNSMTAAVALAAVNRYAQSNYNICTTKKDLPKSTELKVPKQGHKEDEYMEIDMPTSVSIPISTSLEKSHNPHSESYIQRRKLARQYTREQKKLLKQKSNGKGSLRRECLIYRQDGDESEEDDNMNGEKKDISSAGKMSSRKRNLEDKTKNSTPQNIGIEKAIEKKVDNSVSPLPQKHTKKNGKKRVRLEIKDKSTCDKSSDAVPISVLSHDQQDIRVEIYQPPSNPLENDSSDKSKKVDEQNKDGKSTGRATGIPFPHNHDVISGRGNYSTFHPGNHRFRNIICKIKKEYMKSSYNEKKKHARYVVDKIRSLDPPGRFLKRDTTCAARSWYELGEKETLAKTRQALRESGSNHPKEKKKKKVVNKKSISRQGGCLEEQAEKKVADANTIEQEAISKIMMQVADVNTIEQETIQKKLMDGSENYRKQKFLEKGNEHQQPPKYQQHQKQSLVYQQQDQVHKVPQYQQQHQVHKVSMHFQEILPWPNGQPENQQILIRNNLGQRQLQPKQKMNLGIQNLGIQDRFGVNNGDTRSERSN